MRTIEQQVTVQFHAVEAQDIITMLPVCDRLVQEFEDSCRRFNKEFVKSTDTLNDNYLMDIAKKAVEKFNQMKCLHKLGFMSSVYHDFRDYEALTVAYYYGLKNEIQDQMQNGLSPAQALAEFDIL